MEPPPGAAGNSKLRHVEKDVLIPQIMRDRAKELCSDKVQAFTKCCQETGILMVVKCRQENTALKDCLVGYQNLIASFGPTDASQASKLPSASTSGAFLFKCYSLDMAMSDWIGNAACSKLSGISPSSPELAAVLLKSLSANFAAAFSSMGRS
ncbi:hypothetical protein TURU_055941 [Turdus rufiventris]|nr:hypothetical protein TURU_055941 [Turdus rufiventris]